MGDGAQASGVDQVREALAILLAILPVVAGGGDGLAVEGEDFLGLAVAAVERGFDGDAPRAAVGLGALGAQLAGDFDQVVVDAKRLEAVGDLIDDGTGGDAVELDADGGILAELIALDAQVLLADVLTQSGECCLGGKGSGAPVRGIALVRILR